MASADTETWLSNEDLAGRYGVPLETVYKWRSNGTGPRGGRFGKHVRYRLSDVETWEQGRLDPESAA